MTRIISIIFAFALLINLAYAETPLETAIKNGDFELTKSMLESGTNANDGDPFSWAIRANRLDLVKLLLQHNSDINRRASLVDAITYKKDNIAEYILNETNIRINQRLDYDGENTYLYHAIENKRHKIMLTLLEKGAHAIDNGWNPSGSDVERKIEFARNKPLQTAADLGDPIAIRLLLEFGANPNAITISPYGDSLLFAGMLSKTSDPKVVEAFIRKGLDVKKYSYPILEFAVKAAAKGNFNMDVIKMLVNAGADLNAKNPDNLTPVIYAMTLPKSKERDAVVAYLKKL